MQLFCVYVLESSSDGKRYIGSTNNLKRRLTEHQNGSVHSTKYRGAFTLIYVEGSTNESDAHRRERYLKTTKGRHFLAKRLIEYYRTKKL